MTTTQSLASSWVILGWLLAGALAITWAASFWAGRRTQASRGQRLQVRASERESVARHLHDTLLQGLQGLMLRFQAVADSLPADSEARQQIEQALMRADEVLVEGRDRAAALRLPLTDFPDLIQTLTGFGRDLAENHTARFDLRVEGDAREIVFLVHEEICFIAREALFNAFQHAHAQNIVLLLTFGESVLSLSVSDDGRGMPVDFEQSGGRSRTKHWGLAGMRDRANRAGGHLQVMSRPSAGTEVAVEIPAEKAYAQLPARPNQGCLRTIWRRIGR